MSISQVTQLLNPKAVAILGASDDMTKWGGSMMQLLLAQGFSKEKVFPVHPKQSVVQGLTAYKDIASVPAAVDIALIAVPVAHVSASVTACATAGVKCCLIISSNFAEVGPEGLIRQQELVRAAQSTGMRLVGPNCMGLLNTHQRFVLCNLTAARFYSPLPEGPIGVVSQSGALMGTMLAYIYSAGMGVSSAVSLGNQADLELCDFFEYLIDDEKTQVICLYVEGFISPARFIALCRKSIAMGKPVLLTKAGRSAGGAHAVQSHTGSLAGEYASLEAVCQETGVQLIPDVLDLVTAAMAFCNLGVWRTGGVAVMTASGGGGALVMDAMEEDNLQAAQLCPATRKLLSSYMPDSHLTLPLDAGVLAAHSGTRDLPASFKEAALTVMKDPDVGIGLYLMTTQPHMEAFAKAIVETTRECSKPVLMINLASELGQAASQVMREAGMVEFRQIGSAVRTVTLLRSIARSLRPDRQMKPYENLLPDSAVQSILRLLPATRADGETVTLSEADTKRLLSKAGLPVPMSELAQDEDDAVRIADNTGYPVVLKLEAEGVTHKTDLGGIRLNLQTPDQVRNAFSSIVQSAQQHGLTTQIRGCQVQQMVPGDVELIVGARWDEQFGTMMLIGLGGTYVELFNDVQLLCAPTREEVILESLKKLKFFPLLGGYRGTPNVDLAALCGSIAAISQFAAALGDRLVEFDINPLRVSGDRLYVADARAVIR